MDWSYVAGFYDGEGTATLGLCDPRRGPFYRIALYNTHQPTIEAIAEFMRSHGIRITVSRRDRGNPKHKPAFAINIKDVASMLVFIDGVLPYSVTKRERLIVVKRWGGGIVSKPRVEADAAAIAVGMYRRGSVTLKQVSAITGISSSTIHRRVHSAIANLGG